MGCIGVVDDADDRELDLGVVEPVQSVLVGGEEQLVLPSPSEEEVLDVLAGGLRHLVH